MSSLFCCCFTCCRRRDNERAKEPRVPPPDFLTLKRRCFPRDLVFTILFIACWIVLVAIAVFAFVTGNPLSLMHASDYDHNICGYATGAGNDNRFDLLDKPFLWYPVQISALDVGASQTIEAIRLGWCVSECPALSMDVVCHYNFRNVSPEEQVSMAVTYFKDTASRDPSKGCAFNQFPTEPVGRRCIPNLAKSKEAQLVGNVTGLPSPPSLGDAQMWFFDLVFSAFHLLHRTLDNIRAAWLPLTLTVLFTALGCALFIILCRIVVGPILYSVLVLLLAVLILATVISLLMGSWYLMQYLYGGNYSNWFVSMIANGRMEHYRGMQVFYGIGGALAIISFLYFCLMVFLISRIKVAVAVIKVSTQAMFKMPSMLALPLLVLVAVVLGTAFAFTVALFLQSFTRPTTMSIPALGVAFDVTKDSPILIVMHLYNLFAYFWTVAYLNAVSYTSVAASVAAWYFSARGDQKKAPWFVAFRALFIITFVHSGSLLFGSLVIALLKSVRAVYNRLRSRTINATNPVLNVFDKIFKCFMLILTKIVKFFNKNVYIVIAITGHNYCLSVQRAFILILGHILQFATVNFMSDFLIFLGKVGIAALGGVFCWAVIFLHNTFVDKSSPIHVQDIGRIEHLWVPIVVAVVISFLVANMFLSLYETTIDTMFLCYCEDKRANSGSDHGLFMPSSLLATLSLSKRISEKRNRKKRRRKTKVIPISGGNSSDEGR